MTRRQRQGLCLMLALWMVLCSPASSQAFLTELVVGGSLLVEIGGAVAAALPQLTLFATSVLTLAKSSEEIADTVSRIIGIFIPTKKQKAKPASSSPAPSSEAGAEAPVVETTPVEPPVVEETTTEAAPSGDTAAGSIEERIDLLVLTFTRQIGLLRQLQELPEGDPAREALGSGYAELVSKSSEQIEDIVTGLLDGMRDGDKELVARFVEKASSLDAASRVAIVPVVAQVVERGKSFSALHGTPVDATLFEQIVGLYKQLNE